jgi:hypothetical protein
MSGPNGGPIETADGRERLAAKLAALAEKMGAPGDTVPTTLPEAATPAE